MAAQSPSAVPQRKSSDPKVSPSRVLTSNPALILFIKLSVMRQQLIQVKDFATKRPLRDDDFAPLLASLADPQTLEPLIEPYIDWCVFISQKAKLKVPKPVLLRSLKAIAKFAPINNVQALASHLCNYVASSSSPRAIAASAKGIVQSFHTIFDEFQSRTPGARDEDSLVLLVNTVFAKLVDSIKPARHILD